MVAREAPVIYVTEPWDTFAVADQNAVGSDTDLLREATLQQDPDLHYETPTGARYVQSEETVARGNIIGKVIFPVPTEHAAIEIRHWKRFAVVAHQSAFDLSGEIRFIPIDDLPKNQDAGSLKTLRFSNVRKMIVQSGGSAASIDNALAQIPESLSRSQLRVWKKRGGHPRRRGSMKRMPQSYHFGAPLRGFAHGHPYRT